MRVCMLVRNAFTRDARVLREARSLASAGHDVTVVALRVGGLPEQEEVDGFRVLRSVAAGPLAGPTIRSTTGLRRRLLPRAALAVWLRDKRIASRMIEAALAIPADIYHAHDLNTLEAGVAAAREHSARLVYDSHELYPDLTAFKPRERRRWMRLEKSLINRADAIIAPSVSLASVLVERYGVREPSVVMNCPDAISSDAQTAAVAEARRGARTLLIYAGAYTPNRGLENVVRAVEQLEDCRLVMMGWGPLEPRLRAIASDRVRFVEPVAPDEVPAAVSPADIGVVPFLAIGRNHEVAAPNKLFEYLHGGVAIAASDLPEIRRVVEQHDVGALFQASDPSSLAAAVAGILPRLETLRANARRAASSYTWRSQEKVLLEVYARLSPR